MKSGDQAVGPCNALARDIERRAMIGRGAHKGQSERDIHAVVESKRLQRDKRLIVRWAQGHVVARACPGMKQSVRGMWAGNIDAHGSELCNGRFQDIPIFRADGALLSGMGIQSRQCQPWSGKSELAAKASAVMIAVSTTRSTVRRSGTALNGT